VRLANTVFALLILSSVHPVSAQQIVHPEDLAGRWEASDGSGGEVGMNILISTTVAGTVTSLVDVPQAEKDFEIALYRHRDTNVRPLEFNFFTTSSAGVAWDDRELHIDHQRRADVPGIHVKLAWNEEAKVWTGSFELGAFRARAIRLRRPAGPQKSLFVGTWFNGTRLGNNCLHIAQSQDGTLAAWSDDLQVPGRMSYANGIQRPERVTERYGQIAKVKLMSTDRIEVELKAYTAICCSLPFSATISYDANSLVGAWLPGPMQRPRPVRWTRVQGGSCRSAGSHPWYPKIFCVS
jgi:hypothetical protein